MSSQPLHDLLDDVENAWREIKGIKPAVDAKLGAALGKLREHAESDGSRLFADIKTAAGSIARDMRRDVAPVISDVESGARDLVQSGEQAYAEAAGSGDAAESTPQPEPEPGVAAAEPGYGYGSEA